MSGLGLIAGQAGANIAQGAVGQGLGVLFNKKLQKENFKWSEQAADNAYERQLDMYNIMYQDKSPANVAKQLGEAGLNKGLMFGGGASGVGGAASGTSTPQGGQFQTQRAGGDGLGINIAQLKALQAEIDNKNADTELKRKQAENTSAQTQTTDQSRQAIIDKLVEDGKSVWIENARKKFEDWYSKDTPKEEGGIAEHERYGRHAINVESIWNEGKTTEILNSLAEIQSKEANALLTNNKAKGYFTELLNDTMRADATAIQAAAQKLASEWNTGEFTNWKTWAEYAKTIVSAGINKIPVPKK